MKAKRSLIFILAVVMGLSVFALSACGHKHELVENQRVEATCTEDGHEAYWSCTGCDKIFKDKDGKTETTLDDIKIAAKGHSITKVEAVAPTCTEVGYQEHWKCSVCNKLFKDAQGNQPTTLDALRLPITHKLQQVAEVPATCTTEGVSAHWKCSVCDKLFKDQQGTQPTTLDELKIEKVAHTLQKVEATASTCAVQGVKEHWKCSVCGNLFKDAQGTQPTTLEDLKLPLLPHTTSIILEDGVYYKVCSECDFKEKVADAGISAQYPAVVTTAQQLAAAVKDKAFIKLDADITVSATEINNALLVRAPTEGGAKTTADKIICIDLNNKTLTIPKEEGNKNIFVQNGIDLTVKNGKLVLNNAVATSACIAVETGSSIAFDTLTITSTGSVLLPRGDAAKVDINKCNITTTGVYVVSTNAATTQNYNVVITIKESTLATTADDGDACPVMLNVAGTLNMNDVVVNGQRQGIIVRAGDATLTNVQVNVQIPDINPSAKDKTTNPKIWVSGNEVAYGALVIGNNQQDAYMADAVVVATNCQFKATAVGGMERFANAIYLYKGTTRNANFTAQDCTAVGNVVRFGGSGNWDGNSNFNVLTDWNADRGFVAGGVVTHPVKVANVEELGDALLYAKYIELLNNITVSIYDANAVFGARVPNADVQNKEIVMLLNKHKLTITKPDEVTPGESLNLRFGTNLTVLDGTMDLLNAEATTACIGIETGSSITLEDVTINSTGSVLYPRGDAAKVDIKRCNITTTGVYVVATNAATVENYNVVIRIEESTLTTNAADGDACPVMINVAGNLTMMDVDVNGQRQGIIVRAGNATLMSVRVNVTLPVLTQNAIDKTTDPTLWGSGNEVAYGALVVGNNNEGAYKANAIVSINNCTFTCNAPAELEACKNAMFVYKGTTRKAEVTIVAKGTFNGKVVNFNESGTIVQPA